MRKIRFAPIAVLLLGGLGAFVRHVQLETAYDPAGLPRPWAAATVALYMLGFLALAIAVAMCLAARDYEAGGSFRRAIPVEGYIHFAAKALMGIVVMFCALLLMRRGVAIMGMENSARWPFVLLLGLTGFGMTVMACTSYTRKDSPYLRPGSIAPALLCCYWMVGWYRENAGNPILLDYCFRCLALAFGCFSAFSRAGYAFGRRNITGTLLLSSVAVFLLPVAAADPAPLAMRVPLALYAVYTALDLMSLLSAAKPKETPPEKTNE